MCKFNKKDIIKCINLGMGFEKATVLDIVTINNKKMYLLKIPCGTATIPIGAEVNYKKLK